MKIKKSYIAIIFILVLCIIAILFSLKPPAETLKIQNPTEVQLENLETLCYVWGLSKYYHPSSTTGDVNWDDELADLLPEILNATDKITAEEVMFDWLNAYGEVPILTEKEFFKTLGIEGDTNDKTETDSEELMENTYLFAELDLTWIDKLSNEDLKEYMINLSKVLAYYPDTPLTNSSQLHTLHNEVSLPSNNNDQGLVMRQLFKIWNILEYWYPFKDMITPSLNEVLPDLIYEATTLQGEGNRYLPFFASIFASTKDNHVYYSGSRVGKLYQVPVAFRTVADEIAIVEVFNECGLQVGDVILEIEGTPIATVIDNLLEVTPNTSSKKVAYALGNVLLRSDDHTLPLTIVRDGKKQMLEASTRSYNHISNEDYLSTPIHKLLNHNIAYVNFGVMLSNKYPNIIEEYMDTKGLIVDFRMGNTVHDSMNNFSNLLNENTVFNNNRSISPFYPGKVYSMPWSTEYVLNPEATFYNKPIIVLINENTVSAPEIYATLLKTNPNVTIIGEPTLGAAGEFSSFEFVDGYTTGLTWIGMTYPNNGDYQGNGVTPDIEVNPTIKGIKEGRDEILEKAIELLDRN